jgi:hypothetical protein
MLMGDYYILDGKTPVECDPLTWAKWVSETDTHVAYDELDGATVSTIFLGRPWAHTPRLLFETMVFGLGDAKLVGRYPTWETAEAGHAEALELARRTLAGKGA